MPPTRLSGHRRAGHGVQRVGVGSTCPAAAPVGQPDGGVLADGDDAAAGQRDGVAARDLCNQGVERGHRAAHGDAAGAQTGGNGCHRAMADTYYIGAGGQLRPRPRGGRSGCGDGRRLAGHNRDQGSSEHSSSECAGGGFHGRGPLGPWGRKVRMRRGQGGQGGRFSGRTHGSVGRHISSIRRTTSCCRSSCVRTSCRRSSCGRSRCRRSSCGRPNASRSSCGRASHCRTRQVPSR